MKIVYQQQKYVLKIIKINLISSYIILHNLMLLHSH